MSGGHLVQVDAQSRALLWQQVAWGFVQSNSDFSPRMEIPIIAKMNQFSEGKSREVMIGKNKKEQGNECAKIRTGLNYDWCVKEEKGG